MKLFLFLILALSLNAEEPKDELAWNPRIPRRGDFYRPSCGAHICPPPQPECYDPPICCPEPELPTSHMQFGGSYTYAFIKPSSHSSTRGSLGGLQASYEYKTYNRFYGAGFAFWKQGMTEGSGTRFLVQFDIQERLGYTWGSCENEWSLSLYSGFGYRRNAEHIHRHGNKLRFYYNEFYIPLGLSFQESLSCYVDWGINFQWMPQVYSTLLLSPLNGARWVLNNKYANFRGEVPFTFYLTCSHRLFLVLNPFFEYWRDGHTSARTKSGLTLHVPGNTYLFPGLNLNVGFSF